ncbi:MAG: C_GCAxxG_C_C family protein [Desulfobacterales bacterium]|nr:MAG: C_GCAxxG_C_C family protein [Desulfobacterales bacterium]
MAALPSREELFRKLNHTVKHSITLSGNCAQTAFLALQQQFQLEGGAILKALTPFPGGVALRGETCGAVVGCLMALGLVFGREELHDLTGYFDTLPAAQEFCRRFEEKLGGTMCRDILKADLRKRYAPGIAVESRTWRQTDAIAHRAAVVNHGVRIAAEIILAKG